MAEAVAQPHPSRYVSQTRRRCSSRCSRERIGVAVVTDAIVVRGAARAVVHAAEADAVAGRGVGAFGLRLGASRAAARGRRAHGAARRRGAGRGARCARGRGAAADAGARRAGCAAGAAGAGAARPGPAAPPMPLASPPLPSTLELSLSSPSSSSPTLSKSPRTETHPPWATEAESNAGTSQSQEGSRITQNLPVAPTVPKPTQGTISRWARSTRAGTRRARPPPAPARARPRRRRR